MCWFVVVMMERLDGCDVKACEKRLDEVRRRMTLVVSLGCGGMCWRRKPSSFWFGFGGGL